MTIDVDAIMTGYKAALFFTDEAQGVTVKEWRDREARGEEPSQDGSFPGELSTEDLAPETLAMIERDVRAFVEAARGAIEGALALPEFSREWSREEQIGHDLWLTRNGHGAGFWDRDAEVYGPHWEALDKAARAMGGVDSYMGDDGRVHLS